MENDPKDGGPAFPTMDDRRLTVSDGMALRDYFAAKAMAAIISGDASVWADVAQSSIAKSAYLQADAMLKARAA